ncbi:hypothetical protein [Sporomusa termitida]|uniref:Uncharacterized protein n=1 Tax=Sporomusa termitida TaxID=2377 RepID=A0A517DNF5_9FIRM|nr:hypothetical protein [Sporomusa termitida]QDR78895.1 hypothetical protein SPTER_01450 [Sporomusa termitida]
MPKGDLDTMAWPALNYLYGAVPAGNYLHTIDYAGGAIVTVAMAGNAFAEAGTMPFPAYFNASEGPDRPPLAPAGQQHNGVALLKVGNSLLALFTSVDEPWGAAAYQASTLVRLRIEPTTGALSYTAGDYVKVGKNALALEPFAFTFNNGDYNNIYVPCIGGPQHFGRHNPDSRLDIVDLSTMTARTVFQAGPAGSTSDQLDFRDIVIGNRGDTYILAGRYNEDYATFRGRVYKTTAAVLQLQVNSSPAPALLSQLTEAVDEMAAAPGFLWALLYENALPVNNDRLWFVRGNQIDIYNPPPASLKDAPCRTLRPAADLGFANINSVTPLWQPPLIRSTQHQASRSLAAQARLAWQARAAALKARGELRTDAENKSV